MTKWAYGSVDPRMASEDFVALWNTRGKLLEQTVNASATAIAGTGVTPQDQGAVGDGVHDDAAAFSRAFQSGAKRLVIPPPRTFYRLASPVNATGLNGMLIDSYAGLGQSVEPIQFAHNGVGFDGTGSRFFHINDLNYANVAGYAPLCGLLLARDSSLGNAGIHRLNNLHARGDFQNGFVYNYASEELEFTNAMLYATAAGTPVVTHTASNIAGLTSSFRTIATGVQSCTVLRHRGGSYYHAGSGATKVIFLLDGCHDLSFRDQFWYCGGGLAYIHVKSAVSHVKIDAIRMEPATPQANYGVYFELAVAGIPTYWTLSDMRADASTNMIYGNDNTELQHLDYRQVSDTNVVGVSLKNASYLDYRGFKFTGRAGGVVERSVFTGPKSTHVFNGTAGKPNIFLDSDTGGITIGGAERSGQITPTEAVLVSGVDAATGNSVKVTLTAARVVGAPLNPTIGQRVVFTFVQDAVGGWAVTWNAVFKVTWSNVGNAALARSSIAFIYDGTNWNQDGAQTPYV